jgi:hypothetical protein
VLSTVFAHRLTDTLVGAGASRAEAAQVAAAAGRQTGGTGGSGPIPAALQAAVKHDFAVATQWVLWGMALALGIAFLVSLAHPGGQPQRETPAVPVAPGASDSSGEEQAVPA